MGVLSSKTSSSHTLTIRTIYSMSLISKFKSSRSDHEGSPFLGFFASLPLSWRPPPSHLTRHPGPPKTCPVTARSSHPLFPSPLLVIKFNLLGQHLENRDGGSSQVTIFPNYKSQHVTTCPKSSSGTRSCVIGVLPNPLPI